MLIPEIGLTPQTLARFRDPLGGRWLCLAALPIGSIAPTPFQRDLSDAHAKRLTGVIETLDLFLDPVIAVPAPEAAEPVRRHEHWGPGAVLQGMWIDLRMRWTDDRAV